MGRHAAFPCGKATLQTRGRAQKRSSSGIPGPLILGWGRGFYWQTPLRFHLWQGWGTFVAGRGHRLPLSFVAGSRLGLGVLNETQINQFFTLFWVSNKSIFHSLLRLITWFKSHLRLQTIWFLWVLKKTHDGNLMFMSLEKDSWPYFSLI